MLNVPAELLRKQSLLRCPFCHPSKLGAKRRPVFYENMPSRRCHVRSTAHNPYTEYVMARVFIQYKNKKVVIA
jgi:hypothetical protein